MCCWDPRNFPVAIIGHNCIKTIYKGNGFGKKQLSIALVKLKGKGFQKVTVSTGLLEFFIPAQKMYESVGFYEINRDDLNFFKNKMHAQIYYEIKLSI